MVLDYAGKQVTLVPLLEERDPRFLELCPSHAASLDVPRGWDLVDDRDEEPAEPTGPPTAAEMGSSATVAVLAAALREPAEPEQPVGPESVDDLVDASDPVAPRPTLVEPTEPVAAGDTRPTPPSGRTAQPVHPDRRQRPTDQRQLPLEGTLPGEGGGRAPAPADRVAAPRPVPAAREARRTSSS